MSHAVGVVSIKGVNGTTTCATAGISLMWMIANMLTEH
jgi:hypothetical protein